MTIISIIDYLNILLFICLAICLAIFLIVLANYLSPEQVADFEKLSAYECGFMPVGDARQPFHVRFYLVGVLFLLFDLEVIFLFPWVLYSQILITNFWILIIILIFIIFLILGFLYELVKGALDWE